MTVTHKRVLAYINRYRKAIGRRPLKRIPKGVRADRRSCPVALATGAHSVVTSYIRPPWQQAEALRDAGFNIDYDGSVVPPQYISDWIARFDRLQYPELIQR